MRWGKIRSWKMRRGKITSWEVRRGKVRSWIVKLVKVRSWKVRGGKVRFRSMPSWGNMNSWISQTRNPAHITHLFANGGHPSSFWLVKRDSMLMWRIIARWTGFAAVILDKSIRGGQRCGQRHRSAVAASGATCSRGWAPARRPPGACWAPAERLRGTSTSKANSIDPPAYSSHTVYEQL